MAMGTSMRSPRMRRSTSSTCPATRSNSTRSSPSLCAAGTKSPAAIVPSVGWSQRDSASADTMRPVVRLSCGCSTTLMPSPVPSARRSSARVPGRPSAADRSGSSISCSAVFNACCMTERDTGGQRLRRRTACKASRTCECRSSSLRLLIQMMGGMRFRRPESISLRSSLVRSPSPMAMSLISTS